MAKKQLASVVYVNGQAYGPDDDVPKDIADQIGDHAWTTAGDSDEETVVDSAYVDWSEAQLNAEIKKRNKDRAEADQIDASKAPAGDLASRLVADDVGNAGA